jgi:hypothetical protein
MHHICMLKILKIIDDTDENEKFASIMAFVFIMDAYEGVRYYLLLAHGFLLGPSSDIILISSGVGSVSLSNLPLTSPLGASIHIELPS